MPDSRTLGTPRSPINRPNGTISNGIIRSSGISRTGDLNRGITSEPLPLSMPQSQIDAINTRIVQNASHYLDLPIYAQASQATVTTDGNGEIKTPFEVLADTLLKAFGGSTYNPPLQQQSYGYGSTGSFNLPLLLIIGGIGIAVYFYFRNK